MSSPARPPDLFSGDWARQCCRELGASEAYRTAAASWEGALVLVMTATPEMGVPEERSVYLDLHHGECRGARAAEDADRQQAPFVLLAPPAAWKRVLRGELDPLVALMTGKLKLVRGNLARLTPYVKAAQELVRAAGRVEAALPMGWAESEG